MKKHIVPLAAVAGIVLIVLVALVYKGDVKASLNLFGAIVSLETTEKK
jgi:hypothetical protein